MAQRRLAVDPKWPSRKILNEIADIRPELLGQRVLKDLIPIYNLTYRNQMVFDDLADAADPTVQNLLARHSVRSQVRLRNILAGLYLVLQSARANFVIIFA